MTRQVKNGDGDDVLHIKTTSPLGQWATIV